MKKSPDWRVTWYYKINGHQRSSTEMFDSYKQARQFAHEVVKRIHATQASIDQGGVLWDSYYGDEWVYHMEGNDYPELYDDASE